MKSSQMAAIRGRVAQGKFKEAYDSLKGEASFDDVFSLIWREHLWSKILRENPELILLGAKKPEEQWPKDDDGNPIPQTYLKSQFAVDLQCEKIEVCIQFKGRAIAREVFGVLYISGKERIWDCSITTPHSEDQFELEADMCHATEIDLRLKNLARSIFVERWDVQLCERSERYALRKSFAA